jgi:hypothetical protein
MDWISGMLRSLFVECCVVVVETERVVGFGVWFDVRGQARTSKQRTKNNSSARSALLRA